MMSAPFPAGARAALILGALAAGPGARDALGQPANRDSVLATARVLSGETGLGPASRVARRPETRIYAEYLRDRLAARVAAWGGTAHLEAFDPGFGDAPPDSVRWPYANVVARIPGNPGTAAPGYFVVGGHFDTTNQADIDSPGWNPLTWDAPGADDNGSGVAAVLEALRLLAERDARPEADILVVFFDGEELQPIYDENAAKYLLSGQSRLGSEHLADSLIAEQDVIYGVVVADMVAYNPRVDSLVVVTNAASRWLADAILAAQGDSAETGLAAGLQVTRLVRGLTFSDHGPFWERGVDGILLLEAALVDPHAPHYHRAMDRVDATYSRNGSQAAKTAEILASLFLTWSRPGSGTPSELLVNAEDILVQDSVAVDLAVVSTGVPVDIRVGVSNRGGTEPGPWSIEAEIQDLDGRRLRSLGREDLVDPLPSGAHSVVRFPWIPGDGEAGAVRIVAGAWVAGSEASTAARLVSVEADAGAVTQSFVYPNPTREPESAVIRYVLARGGPVRIEILNLRAERLAVWEAGYDAVRPSGTVDVGAADVSLGAVLGGVTLAPGLYLVRIQLFTPEGESADVTVARFAVLR